MIAGGAQTFVPAAMTARFLARVIDFAVMCSVGGILFALGAFYIVDQCLMSHCPYSDSDLWVWFGFSVAIAVIVEFLVETLSRTSIGKNAFGIVVKEHKYMTARASIWRLQSRCLMPAIVCFLSAGVGILIGNAVAIDIGITISLSLLGTSSFIVWLSVLLSALCNEDRRGWHDLAAGTMLVVIRRELIAPACGSQLSPREAASERQGSAER